MLSSLLSLLLSLLLMKENRKSEQDTNIAFIIHNKITTDILNINFYSKRYIFLIDFNRQRPKN